jgi:hypothetical protein
MTSEIKWPLEHNIWLQILCVFSRNNLIKWPHKYITQTFTLNQIKNSKILTPYQQSKDWEQNEGFFGLVPLAASFGLLKAELGRIVFGSPLVFLVLNG